MISWFTKKQKTSQVLSLTDEERLKLAELYDNYKNVGSQCSRVLFLNYGRQVARSKVNGAQGRWTYDTYEATIIFTPDEGNEDGNIL